ncbi:MAG: cytochrome c peroxidase [Pseudomonadota bacterium]
MLLDSNSFFSKLKKWLFAAVVAVLAWLWFPDLWKPKLPSLMSEELLKEKIKSHVFPPSFSLPYERRFAEFGKILFVDSRLSINVRVSCATCHDPGKSFTDGRPTAVGIALTERNTPTLVNIAMNSWFFSDGRADSLTAQALGPLLDSREQGLTMAQLAAKVLTLHLDTYTKLYGPLEDRVVKSIQREAIHSLAPPAPSANLLPPSLRIYGIATMGSFSALDHILKLAGQGARSPQDQFAMLSAGVDLSNGSKQPAETQVMQTPGANDEELRRAITEIATNSAGAIEAYERTILSTQSPFDRFAERLANTKTMQEAFDADFSQDEFDGLNLFMGKGNCDLCHSGPNFSDSQFHNIGLPWNSNIDEKKLPTARAQGLQGIKNHPFGCKTPHVAKARAANRLFDLEQCAEVEYLKMDGLESMNAFKTPTLRNLKLTAPYMHDGRFESLEQVINHYSSLPDKPAIGHREESLKELNLTKKEKNQLIKFLLSLDSRIESL